MKFFRLNVKLMMFGNKIIKQNDSKIGIKLLVILNVQNSIRTGSVKSKLPATFSARNLPWTFGPAPGHIQREPLSRMLTPCRTLCHRTNIDGPVKSPTAALRFIFRRCDVLYVRLTPQDSQALHSALFTKPSH